MQKGSTPQFLEVKNEGINKNQKKLSDRTVLSEDLRLKEVERMITCHIHTGATEGNRHLNNTKFTK